MQLCVLAGVGLSADSCWRQYRWARRCQAEKSAFSAVPAGEEGSATLHRAPSMRLISEWSGRSSRAAQPGEQLCGLATPSLLGRQPVGCGQREGSSQRGHQRRAADDAEAAGAAEAWNHSSTFERTYGLSSLRQVSSDQHAVALRMYRG